MTTDAVTDQLEELRARARALEPDADDALALSELSSVRARIRVLEQERQLEARVRAKLRALGPMAGAEAVSAKPQTPLQVASDMGLTVESIFAALRGSQSCAGWIRREVGRRHIAGTAAAQANEQREDRHGQ